MKKKKGEIKNMLNSNALYDLTQQAVCEEEIKRQEAIAQNNHNVDICTEEFIEDISSQLVEMARKRMTDYHFRTVNSNDRVNGYTFHNQHLLTGVTSTNDRQRLPYQIKVGREPIRPKKIKAAFEQAGFKVSMVKEDYKMATSATGKYSDTITSYSFDISWDKPATQKNDQYVIVKISN